MSDNIDISKAPQWIEAKDFRDHAHGSYIVMLDNGYLDSAYFTYHNGGRILREEEDITDSVKWFCVNRTTWWIADNPNPDCVDFRKKRIAELQQLADSYKYQLKSLKKKLKKQGL